MITVSTEEFSRGLQGWANRFNVRNDVAVRNIASRLFEWIIRYTPVDTGWARANWYPSINTRVSVDPGDAPEGAVNIPAAQPAAVVATGKAGDIFFLQNGVSYIKNLEDGTSQQAPEGMVKRAIADVGTFLNQYAGGRR